MAIGFSVNGVTSYTPGVFSHVTVEGSLLNVTPSPRNVLVIGEATDGAPFSDVDMRTQYFTDLSSVKAYYGTGPVVDACSQLFASQPNAIFAGTVGRVYIAKTNKAVRASKAVSAPTGFGTLYAAKYGESGNYIKSIIKDVTTEVKPTVAFSWVPTLANTTLTLGFSGSTGHTGTMDLTAPAASLTAAVAACGAHATWLPATILDVVTTFTLGTLAVTVSGSSITITASTALFDNTPTVGSTLIIPLTSAIKGAADKNIGAYVITAASSSVITATKIKSYNVGGTLEVKHLNPEAVAGPISCSGSQTAFATADLMVVPACSITMTEATKVGAGASLEIAGASQAIAAAGALVQFSSLADIVSQTVSSIASLSVAVSGADVTIAITDGSFETVPAVGDPLFIPAASVIAGATLANVGYYVVKSATQSAIVANRTDGLPAEVVASVFMNGITTAVKSCSGIVANALGGKTVLSTAERSVKIEATDTKLATVFPTNAMGGETVLNISYFEAASTVASVTIDNARRMIFSFTASPAKASITLYLNKYSTIKELVAYLNTLTGFTVTVANSKWNAYPTTILDCAQSVGIMGIGTKLAPVGRIKADYWAWTSFISGSNSLLAFEAGTMVYLAGVPTAEVAASYLSGGALGGTTDANVTDALTAGLLLPVRQVLPCFSRNAQYDVAEGMTDPSSTYTIDGINLGVSGHVSTASSDLNRHERMGLCSFHGSFADSKSAAVAIFNPRVSMTFQQVKTTDASGNVKWFLPWMLQACIAAGRSQAVLGSSMLRKNFRITDARHIGNLPVSSLVWTRDYDSDDLQGDLTEAIQAGLLAVGTVPGSGLKVVSPDLTTQGGVNNPVGWYWERTNVMFILDEVLDTCRNTLENYIGSRTSDVTPTGAASALDSVVGGFLAEGSLLAALPATVTDLGNGYAMQIKVRPVECLEFMTIGATVSRSV